MIIGRAKHLLVFACSLQEITELCWLQSRTDLEQQSIETSNTSEAVGLITYVQSLKRKMKSWEKQVDLYKEGQRLLEKQRFQFPSTWLYSDNMEGEWSAFSDIIRRKDSSIQTQVASLQMKVISEDKLVESRTGELLTEWEKEKPVEVSECLRLVFPCELKFIHFFSFSCYFVKLSSCLYFIHCTVNERWQLQQRVADNSVELSINWINKFFFLFFSVYLVVDFIV